MVMLTEHMVKAMKEKEELKNSGEQLKYRLRYKPKNWFFKYQVEVFVHRKALMYIGGGINEPVCRRGWELVRQFRRKVDAVKTLTELEDVNGVLAPMPAWYNVELER